MINSEQDVELVIEEAAKINSVTKEEVFSKNKLKEICLSRQIAFYLIRKNSPWTLVRIGKFMNNRDHTTVMSNISRLEDFLSYDKKVRKMVSQCVIAVNERLKEEVIHG